MEKIFTVVEVPKSKKVNIGTFYLAGEADIWWNTIKHKWQELELTWAKFTEELRAQFYPVTLQRQKEKEFMELKMTGSMTILQYASKFTELSRFAPEIVASERMKMRRFEEGLAFYIRNQLAGQPIKTYQELYEWAAEVERIKSELRVLNPVNLKRKWNDRGASSNIMASKKPTISSVKSSTTGPPEPCRKCSRMNHHTSECRIGTNQCVWCGSTDHLITACLKRLRAVEKGVAKPLAPLRQVPAPPRPPVVGRAYIMNRKEAANSSTVITGTFFSKFYAFFCST